jgi:hypothetical protein
VSSAGQPQPPPQSPNAVQRDAALSNVDAQRRAMLAAVDAHRTALLPQAPGIPRSQPAAAPQMRMQPPPPPPQRQPTQQELVAADIVSTLRVLIAEEVHRQLVALLQVADAKMTGVSEPPGQ